MNSRSIGSTPNRQHTTAINHSMCGKLGTRPMTKEEKLERREYLAETKKDHRRRHRLTQVLKAWLGEGEMVENICKKIKRGHDPKISRTYGGFKITFQ